MAKYHGWANKDTWALVTYILDVEKNYNFVARNKARLLKATKPQLIAILKPNIDTLGGTINWTKISVTDIKRMIRDMF